MDRVDRDRLITLVDRAATIGADQATVCASLEAIDRLVAWCEAQRLACARQLEVLVAVPEQVLAEVSRISGRQAEQVIRRAQVVDVAPEFAGALHDGSVSAGHLDQLAHTFRRLEPDARQAMAADAQRLVAIAAHSTPDEFARTLRREERRLASDDGMPRLQRQRRAVRLYARTDLEDGMHVWTLRLDPVTGLKLSNTVAALTEAMFHDRTPDGCPTDPFDKQAFLRAHAFLHIVQGNGVRLARPEFIAVVDTTDQQHPPQVDWGLPVEIPDRVLRDLWPDADVHAVVIRNGVVLHAAGQLDLGRATRLANRAQRRALRALYATCAVPGCAIRYDNCTIHHIFWWRHGGSTDLHNLLPLCGRHHHNVHDHGWKLALDKHRRLTITYPDGTTMTTGPPSRKAA